MNPNIISDGSIFGASVNELKNLMQSRGKEGFDQLSARYGSVLGLCRALATSSNEGNCLLII